MKFGLLHFCLVGTLFCGVGSPLGARAAEIRVKLFEETCLLAGPFSEAVLREVHAMSPERLTSDAPVELLERLLPMLKNPESLKGKSSGAQGAFPMALQSYREQQVRRVQSWIAFHRAMASARKTGAGENFLENIREHLLKSKLKDFESRAREMMKTSQPGKPWSPLLQDRLTMLFDDSIVPDPEEDFHRAIRQSKIVYSCDFDSHSE